MRAAPGLCGKLPARGDFVRRGLPRGFAEPWDAWWDAALQLVRAADVRWVEAWLGAPVWRFLLPPGACGPWPETDSPVSPAMARAMAFLRMTRKHTTSMMEVTTQVTG